MKLMVVIEIRGMHVGGGVSVEVLQAASVTATFHLVAEKTGLRGFQSSTSQLLAESSISDHLYY